MNIYKIIVGISTIVYAVFIFNYPASYYNDDSLFFTKGIENFSVIDFSPHFPGYPFVVIMGKIINLFINDAKYSLFILTAICGILLPLTIFLYVKELKNEKVAFIAYLLSLTTPYLLNISLSMLSESVGLLFVFLGLYLLEIKKYKSSGIIFAVSFFSRPSYLILFLVGFVYLYFFKKESVKPILFAFIISSIIFFIFIFINNGILYIYEGKRFIEGHFSLWGRGQNSDLSWYDNIFIITNLPYIFLTAAFFKFKKGFTLLYILFFSYLIWIIFAQNPQNLRHLIPLILIANIFLAEYLKNFNTILAIIISWNIFNIFQYTEKLSPLEQIAKEIKNENKIVISNRGIEILREVYNFRVADNYYKESAAYLSKKHNIYIITTKKPKNQKYKTFHGRFIGEHNYFLLKL